MKVNNFIVAGMLSGLMFYCGSGSANSEFQQWMQQQSRGVDAQKKEFQEYKDKRDKEFTAFLKAHWKAVDIVKGEVRDDEPKPVVLPVAPPMPAPGPEPVKSADKPVLVTVPEPEPVKQPAPMPVVAIPKGRPLTVDLYGRRLTLYYDAALRKRLGSNINKEAVSDYWSALSRTEYEGLLKQLAEHKKSLQLNDWAYASLVHKAAVSINNNRRNEGALLSWFLLAKSGYKARVAFTRASVYLLVPSKHEMFEVSYFTFSGVRYYSVEFDGNRHDLGQVYTYDGEYPDATRAFDMSVTPVVASNDKDERRNLSFEFAGHNNNIEAI